MRDLDREDPRREVSRFLMLEEEVENLAAELADMRDVVDSRDREILELEALVREQEIELARLRGLVSFCGPTKEELLVKLREIAAKQGEHPDDAALQEADFALLDYINDQQIESMYIAVARWHR